MCDCDGCECERETPTAELGCGWPACGSALVVDLRSHPGATGEVAELVIVGSSEQADLARDLLTNGATATMVQTARVARLMKALSRAASELPDESWSPEADPEVRLTPRETEVLELVALGYVNPEIADRLVISVRTVEAHRRNISKKTGCGTRAELTSFGLNHGLIDR
jgi:DNA-binding NarL/FixJ family response regulator